MANGSIKQSLSKIIALTMIIGLFGPTLFTLKMETVYAATFQVTNTNDSGAGSLRDAIVNANTTPGADEITFTVNGTVTLASALPAITEQVNINATSPAVAGPNFVINANGQSYGLSFSSGSSHIIQGIEVQGANENCISIGGSVSGITIGSTDAEGQVEINGCTSAGINSSGSNITIINTLIGVDTANGTGYTQSGGSNIVVGGDSSSERNVISNNSATGIEISNTSTITITGNYIGTSTSGDADLGNSQSGIRIATGCSSIIIGGDTTDERNVIAGNSQSGIRIDSNGATITGNYIGINAAGDTAIANGDYGILLESSENTIGGATTSLRNVISGNSKTGIVVRGSTRTADDNVITNNYVGTNAAGTAAITNGEGGISVSGGTIAGTQIGGVGEGNLISGNTSSGILLDANTSTATVMGNIIGLNALGTAKIANTGDGVRISGNSNTIGGISNGAENTISGNSQNGIYLGDISDTIIINNYIGTSPSGTVDSAYTNTLDGITLQNGTTNSQIGSAVTSEANVISVAAGKTGVKMDATTGNGNSIRKNNFYGTSYITRGGSANDNISTPVISLATITAVEGSVAGLTGGTIDIYQNGLWMGEGTIDADGTFEKGLLLTEGATIVVTATNTGNSTSATSSGVAASNDITAPSVPVISNTASYTTTTPVVLTGTKEAYSSIVINTVEVIAATDSSTTWSSSQAVVEGANTFTVYSADLASNASANTSYSITKDGVVPSTPTLSATSTSTNSSETITGSGTESGATVYSNGVSTGQTVDGLGSFSISVSLVEGTNTFSKIPLCTIAISKFSVVCG